MKGKTTIVIAHRLSTVMHADKICVVMDGKIIEEGTHKELIKKKGEYANLYNKQFELIEDERGE
jgi:ABC-type multidrug transport system fused ATPase/permease subunit